MKIPKFIGLTGLAGCGKDTVREILEKQHGYEGLALADPIRDMVKTLLDTAGLSPTWATDRDRKEAPSPLGYSYRELAQSLGTEWGREFLHPAFWTHIANMRMQAACGQSFGKLGFVVSDIRFNGEAAWLLEKGGVIWEIRRPDAQKVRPHVSEDGIDEIYVNEIILNDGAVTNLPYLVRAALEPSCTH